MLQRGEGEKGLNYNDEGIIIAKISLSEMRIT